MKMLNKLFSVSNNVGKAKYVVSFHDGVKVHKDKSPFFDIAIFTNKKKLSSFVCNLERDGYKAK
ncbi:MAG: hypothetical protein ACJAS1_003673 [Oleiphilaceae bacterium]|jgi:hypothetical protein